MSFVSLISVAVSVGVSIASAPLDSALLKPYVVGAVVCLAVVIGVLILARLRMGRPNRSNGLLSDNVFEAFFGEAHVGIAVIDEHGAIARTNTVFEVMTGYEQNSLLGKLYVDLVYDPSDAAGRDRVVGALDRFGESHTLTIRRRDGSFFRARFIVSPAPATLSRNQSVVFIEEVGPDRDRDREPLISEEDLAVLDRAPTASTDATITGSGHVTNEHEESGINNFLAVLDDELLTPLTVVAGNISMLEMESVGHDREAIDAVKAGLGQLTERLEILLDFARLQADDVSLRESPGKLVELIEHAVASVAETATLCTPIRIVSKVDDPEVIIDQQAFSTISKELITNAVRFGEGRDVSVSISLQSGQAVLCVSNVGGGFSADEARLVFDSFFQLSSGPSRRFRGFGIGLTIVEKLVTRMGGTIALSSEEGGGATFMVRVPVDTSVSGRYRTAA